MMRVWLALWAAMFAAASGALAAPLESSEPPLPRPGTSGQLLNAPVEPGPAATPRPRPATHAPDAEVAVETDAPEVQSSSRPKPAPRVAAPRTLPPVRPAPVNPATPLPDAIRRAVEDSLLTPPKSERTPLAALTPLIDPETGLPAVLPFAEPIATVQTAPEETRRPRPRQIRLQRISTRAITPRPNRPSEPVGRICGDARLLGYPITPIRGRLAGCRINDPVRVTNVSGVKLSNPVTVNCDTAKSLATWLTNSVKPISTEMLGSSVVSIRPVASYSCRTRNNRRGAKLSEHAKGKAVDIAAFTLADGRTITVLQGWRHRTLGPFLRKVHAKACGPFGTVLGPNSDTYHQDHFHFDVARYRSGAYCR